MKFVENPKNFLFRGGEKDFLWISRALARKKHQKKLFLTSQVTDLLISKSESGSFERQIEEILLIFPFFSFMDLYVRVEKK